MKKTAVKIFSFIALIHLIGCASAEPLATPIEKTTSETTVKPQTEQQNALEAEGVGSRGIPKSFSELLEPTTENIMTPTAHVEKQQPPTLQRPKPAEKQPTTPQASQVPKDKSSSLSK